ncbi:phage baseplate assembly protein V [Methylophaga sp.]|uniref:phage baseplate assembly protein V n=1 Tax=Methylophaga sp. TaxID=2024840 RepID=UPI003A8F9A96
MSPLDRVLLKVRQMVSRGVVLLVNDAANMQEMQLKIMADDTMDGVERFQNYGFTSKPHAGSEAIALTVNGDKSHTVVIAVDDRRYRLKGLENGEVALYDDQGQKIVLKRDQILVEAPKVVVQSDDISLGGEGGAKVARVGDLVAVGSGSSAGNWPIVSGSDKVTAT